MVLVLQSEMAKVTRCKYFVTLLKYSVLKYLLSEYFLLILLPQTGVILFCSLFLKGVLIIHELLQKDVMRTLGPLSNGDTQDHL